MNYKELKSYLDSRNVHLVAVSKTKPTEAIMQLYDQGQRIFGENRTQEMAAKYEALPKDIVWHMIGHLQSNKVKYIAPFVSMIHSVDNDKLLQVIETQARKHGRVIDILLQVKIAEEDTKSGWDTTQLLDWIDASSLKDLHNIRIRGVMGMATYTDNETQVKSEFQNLKNCFEEVSKRISSDDFDTISMGMSGDYDLAIDCGSNMVRIGSLLFGAR